MVAVRNLEFFKFDILMADRVSRPKINVNHRTKFRYDRLNRCEI